MKMDKLSGENGSISSTDGSILSERGGGSRSGRFVKRFEEQEQQLVLLKERCDLLTIKCRDLELWKSKVQRWIQVEFGDVLEGKVDNS